MQKIFTDAHRNKWLTFLKITVLTAVRHRKTISARLVTN